MSENMDIFDRLMALPGFRIFEPFYKKHKEALLYLFFGGIAFFLNLGLFIFFHRTLKINELIANIFCWIICVLFQFFTNKTWVFAAKAATVGVFFKQLLSFFSGRFFTLLTEEAILAVFITWLGFNTLLIKILAQIVVIVLNFIISKLIVFRK